ncbi:MAG: RluA family pseudouridine synthase [Paludibacteraceae bacterium]|nr:RluA family pseudouridine synthase [Paludibacteraceae bacterium]
MEVLYEDNHIIAVNKAPGEIVQGDKTGDKPLSDMLKEYIKVKYNKPGEVFLGVPHRLDRPTSGVVLFARTSKALTRLSEMFKEKSLTPNPSIHQSINPSINKIYWAIVQGAPKQPEGHLENWLVRNEAQNKSYIAKPGAKDAKLAILNYRTLATGDHYTLLEIELLTGRHHQIRCQLAAIGCPIKGDLKYGARRSNPDGSICLHARQITFVHPVKKETVTITAPVPKDSLFEAFSPQSDYHSTTSKHDNDT